MFVIRVIRVYTDECPMFLFVLFRTGGKTPDPKMQVRSYVDVMLEQNLSKEEVNELPLLIIVFVTIIFLSCVMLESKCKIDHNVFLYEERDSSATGREGQVRGSESCQWVQCLPGCSET